MRDLQERFADLDLLEIPEMRSTVDARIAENQLVPDTAPVRPLPTPRWRGPLVAVGTAAAIVIAVAAAVFITRGVATTEGPIEASVAPSTPTTIPAVDVQSLDWMLTELDRSLAGHDGAELVSVTTGGPGFVAVGSTICPGTSGCNDDAAVWTSTDGISWERVPHDPDVFGSGTDRPTDRGLQAMEDVASVGSRVVAVGMALDEEDRPGLYAAIWTSVDGNRWSRVQFDREVFGSHLPSSLDGDGTWIHSVAVGGPGFVAVGADSGAAAVWTSPDGVTWTRVPHDPEVFGDGEPWLAMNAVTAGGPGLVAAGHGERYSGAAIWTSPDGIEWSRVPHDEAVFGGVGFQLILDVTAGATGVVAVGLEDVPDPHTEFGTRAAIWTSPDGIAWMRVPHDPAIFGEGADERQMSSIAATDRGFVAVGNHVWVSSDGLTWALAQDVPTPESPPEGPDWWSANWWEMDDITVGPNGLVTVGTAGWYRVDGEAKPQPAVWTATPRD